MIKVIDINGENVHAKGYTRMVVDMEVPILMGDIFAKRYNGSDEWEPWSSQCWIIQPGTDVVAERYKIIILLK